VELKISGFATLRLVEVNCHVVFAYFWSLWKIGTCSVKELVEICVRYLTWFCWKPLFSVHLYPYYATSEILMTTTFILAVLKDWVSWVRYRGG